MTVGIVGLSHPQRASLSHCILFMRYVMENEFLNIPTIAPHQRAVVPPNLQAVLCWYVIQHVCKVLDLQREGLKKKNTKKKPSVLDKHHWNTERDPEIHPDRMQVHTNSPCFHNNKRFRVIQILPCILETGVHVQARKHCSGTHLRSG